jgi:DNA-binding response OmpR family regulator
MLKLEYGERAPRLIALTGWREPANRLMSQLVGFDDHFSKPYDPGAVLAAITGATRRAASRSAPDRAA